MQGKGIIRVFLVLMTIVCLGQFILIFPTRKVEKAAQEHAQMMAEGIEDARQRQAVEKAARVSYLDSMSSEVVFSLPLLKDYTYTELKQQQLALGLDLKGGMSVVLQVDLRDFIVALSNNSKDPTFIEALDKASERIKTAQSDFVTLFADAFRENTEEKTLASIFSRNQTLRDEINFETPDNEVVQILRTKANETVDLTYKRIKDRIDKFGVTQPNVSLDASRDLIIVELPGVDNPERARSYLQASAKLEFWDVYRVSDPGVIDAFVQADERLKNVMSGDTTDQTDENFRLEERYSYSRDSITGDIIDSTLVAVDTIPLSSDPMSDRGPLLSLLTLNSGGAGEALNYPLSVMGVADRNKKNNVDEMLARPDVKAMFPKDMEFRWSYKPMQDYTTREYTDQYELYAIKTKRGSNVAPLEGDRVTNAGVNPDPRTGEVAVSLTMDNRGTKIWADMTTKAAQDNNREVAIVLDDEVVSAPRVNDAILTGSSQISGNFSIQEAKDLANILQVGKLPASTKIIQESLVGPSLGQENINKSISALIGGFALVFIFMIFYYAGGGIVSILALLLNLFFIFGALASYGTVLTLPGIAGIVLTIGMAVDANVIIFERIKEELRAGKSTMLAIKDGFNQSYSAIIDANVTTLLVAFILAYFGMGPIKGFAVVLIIGVLMSLFTAVLVGRLTIDWWIRKGNNISFWSGPSKNLFSDLNIDWVGKRKLAYVISGTVIALGIVSFFARGFELGVDFKGGYSYNIQFDQDATISADALRTGLTDVFDGATPVVKAVDTRNTFNVVTSYRINDDSDEAAGEVMEALYSGVSSIIGGDLDLENFRNPDGTGTHITSSAKVGPIIADDIRTSSFYAGIFALLMIFLYIFVRFSKWQYSMGAVGALFHDSIVVLSIFAAGHGILPFSLEIDQAFIAALLTVIGYSINDTVIVFDRIREYLGIYTDKPKDEVLNLAINSTFSRTVITSMTTLFVILILFIFGGGSIKGFAFALLIGIIVGTYSSIFIATPILRDLTGELKMKTKNAAKKGFSRVKA